jgi:dienelactone hydrolase
MTDPLGNLHAFVVSISDQNQPALSFLNPQYTDVSAWQTRARQEAMALLRYTPPAVPLDPQTHEVVDKGDYTREKVTFASAPGMRVPAYVLVPKNLDKPAPAVVGLHCHGGYYVQGKEKLVDIEREPLHLTLYKRGGYGGRAFANELVKHGYVVIVIDAFYWGERKLDFQQMPEALVKEMQRRARNKTGVPGVNEVLSLLEELMARHIFAAGATWMGILAHDDRVTVDYLLTRPEVDPDRIGCAGLSMGGMRTNWLFGTDPRIKVAVSAGWMSDWHTLMSAYIGGHSLAQTVPGLMSELELSDVASLGMPNALLVMECAQDSLFPLDGMRTTCERLEAIYRKAGLQDKFVYRFYDVPHQFDVPMQDDAIAWLDKWLK